jgi:hypothetical protein
MVVVNVLFRTSLVVIQGGLMQFVRAPLMVLMQ